MKRFMLITLTVSVVAIAVGPVQTQERQQGSGFDLPGTFFLLTQKSVQRELKLTDEQIKKITELQAKNRDERSKSKGLKGQELRKQSAKHIKAEHELIDSLLKPEQLKRLKQISLQQNLRALPFTLARKEIARALELTDEQKRKIEEIRDEAMKGIRAAGRLDEEGGKKLEAVRKGTNAKTIDVLTSGQKTKLKEMIGERFKGEIVRPFRSGRQKQESR